MSLFNEERPKTWKQVVGQDTVVRQIRAKLADNRFPQAVIMTGPRGCGKTTSARIIAKALNCEKPVDGEPCCSCPSCKAIAEGKSGSVIELDAATNNGVDDVRSILEQLSFSHFGRKKVVILDEVHMFSASAWNALLKTLEEPPENVVFILATTELKVPLTVLSRCCKFEFRKLSMQDMENYLYDMCVKHNINAEPGALELISSHSDGCLRDALSTLEQFMHQGDVEAETVLDFLGMADDDAVFSILGSVITGDSGKAIVGLEELEKRGKNLPAVLKAMIEALTLATAYMESGDSYRILRSEEYVEKLKDFCGIADLARINQLQTAFMEVYPYLKQQNSFLLKAAMVSVTSSESMLSRLERAVEEVRKGTAPLPKPSTGTDKAEKAQDSEAEKDTVLADGFETAAVEELPWDSGQDGACDFAVTPSMEDEQCYGMPETAPQLLAWESSASMQETGVESRAEDDAVTKEEEVSEGTITPLQSDGMEPDQGFEIGGVIELDVLDAPDMSPKSVEKPVLSMLDDDFDAFGSFARH